MTDLLRHFSNGELIALFATLFAIAGGLFLPIFGGLLIAAYKAVAAHRRRLLLDDMEAALKMEMIQRGMSADEIAKILESRMAELPQVPMKMSGKWMCQKRTSDRALRETASTP